MNPLSSKTFCASAWFSARNDNRNKLDVCCSIDTRQSQFQGKTNYNLSSDTYEDWINSEYLQYLRKELNDKMPSECYKCQKAEKYNIRSIRQIYNKSIAGSDDYSNTWLKLYFNKKKDYRNDFIVTADCMVSNLCNFECIMCFPDDSSKIHSTWKKDQSATVVKNMLAQDPLYLDNIKELSNNERARDHLRNTILHQPITFLRIRGGEPFMDEKLMSMLEKIPSAKKEKIRLAFTTNGSFDLIENTNRLKGFKELIVIVSIDAIGVHGEYIRKHSKWNIIEENVLSLVKQSNVLVYITCTIHALNIGWFDDLEDWCKKHDLPIGLTLVSNPNYLSLSALSADALAEEKKKTKNKELIRYINDTVPSDKLHAELLDYIKWYDKTSIIKFEDLPNKKGDL